MPRRVAPDVHAITSTPTGQQPTELRRTFRTDTRVRMEERIFGKRILFTNRETWTIADAVAAHHSLNQVQSSIRQMKDLRVVSFRPMHRWTDSWPVACKSPKNSEADRTVTPTGSSSLHGIHGSRLCSSEPTNGTAASTAGLTEDETITVKPIPGKPAKARVVVQSKSNLARSAPNLAGHDKIVGAPTTTQDAQSDPQTNAGQRL